MLSLGPKFCPVPKTVDTQALEYDVKEGCRKVRLKEFFYDDNAEAGELESTDTPRFYKPTGWTPPAGRNATLDTYCDTLCTYTENFNAARNVNNHPVDNMTKDQRCALKNLQEKVKNRDIRISKADKGGAVVVQDTDDYIKEAERQLNNPLHYKLLAKDTSAQIAKESNKIVKDLHKKGFINDKTKDWAITNEGEVSCHRFYTLPKIHKSLTDTPGRPIVSGVNGPTEKLSKLVDSWLQDTVQKVPSYIKDTTDMLNKVEEWNNRFGPFPDTTKLVTIDVVGLYTNIPHDGTLSAVREQLNANPNSNRPPTETVVNVADHVLSNNVFNFENTFYQQIHGTAMGTPMAPSVANLFMASLEEDMLQNSPVPVNKDLYKRFIDDIFLLWTGSDEDLDTFLDYINTIHPTIKFTHQASRESVSFLDISLSLQDGFLKTDLYTKPTDSHAYLQHSSCHPAHVKRNLPYSQFLRLRRICSDESTFSKRCDELETHLYARGYSRASVKKGREKAREIARKDALSYNNQKKTDRVPFVITHNPLNPPISKWFHELQTNLISTDNHMRNVMPQPPLCGERNSRSLKNILMPSTLPPKKENNPGVFKCKRKKCIICEKHLVEGVDFKSCVTKEQFKVREKFTCDSQNIIYLISCDKCGLKQYTGQSGNSLRTRFYLHRSHIGNNAGTLLTMHFNQHDHSLDDMRCMVIEGVYGSSIADREKRESFWNAKLKTFHPYGLNDKP